MNAAIHFLRHVESRAEQMRLCMVDVPGKEVEKVVVLNLGDSVADSESLARAAEVRPTKGGSQRGAQARRHR